MKRISTVMIIAGIVFAAAACTSVPWIGGHKVPDCTTGNGVCQVDVSVTSCDAITADPYELPVRKKGGIYIIWVLDELSPYRFNPVDGIKLKPNQPDASEFGLPEPQPNGKRIRMFDKNSKATPGQKTHNHYDINIQMQQGGNWVNCKVYDPTIINEG